MYGNEENIMEYKIAHPREIKSYKQSANGVFWTLSVEDYLSPAAESPRKKQDGTFADSLQSPMEIFADYAVFHLTIIEKNGEEKKIVRVNITLEDYEELVWNTRDANTLILKSRWENKPKVEEKPLPKAYTQALAVGECKGQTPAQAILKDEQNVHKLEYTAQWLEDRLQKHPNNKKQYDAIKEALQLYRDDRLSEDITQANSAERALILFDSGIKSIHDAGRTDGKKLVYQYQIECTPGAEYPYRIRLNNYYAVCNGIIPDEKTKTDEKRTSMNLQSKQWLSILAAMKRTKEIYIRAYGSYELKRKEQYIQEQDL